ncbi:MAG: rhodanese-like domain-containing protein, partial [Pseudohongiellaceae bacterium]
NFFTSLGACILLPFFIGGNRCQMAQFIEFVGNHWILSSAWLLLVAAIFFQHSRTSAKSVGPQQAVMLINRADAVVIDVRDKKEYDSGHIVDSINIPLTKLNQRIAELEKYREKPLVIVDKLGQHASEACNTLQKAGYSQAVKLAGGLTEWKAQSLPLIQK